MIDTIKTSSINSSKKRLALPMCIYKRDPIDKNIKTPIINGNKLNTNALTLYLSPNLSRIERSRRSLTSNKALRRAKATI